MTLVFLLLVVLSGVGIACTCCDHAAKVTCGSDKKGDDEHNELIHDMGGDNEINELIHDMGGDALEDSILPKKDDIFEVNSMSMDHIRNPTSPVSFFSHSDLILLQAAAFLSLMTGFYKHQREGPRTIYT